MLGNGLYYRGGTHIIRISIYYQNIRGFDFYKWYHDKEEALEDYDATLELLEEYDANRPLFETNKKLREELAKVTKQRDNYERELVSERMALGLDEYTTFWFPDNR